jgi:hypothetical protein
MEPEIQSPAQEWERWAQEWERLQKSRKAALEKCWTACETGDVIQFNNQIQETLGELGDANMHTLLQRTIIRKGWLEGTCQIKEVIYHYKEVVITGEFKLVKSRLN